jgi:hypothetical protein
MKRTFLVLVTATLLILAGSVAWASIVDVPTINLFDLGEGDPVVTNTGFTSIPIIGNPVVVRADEFANVTGALFSNFITVSGLSDSYGIKMREPAYEGGGVSDFATLTVFAIIPFINTQAFNLTFMSDGAAGFDLALAAFNQAFPNAASIEENGTLQNLFCFSGLVVNAQSDVAPVPIPASALLLGSGMLGLGLVGWRRREKKA